MNHIQPYDLFERNDIEPSLVANEIVDKWELALKTEAQRLFERYFPRRLNGSGNIREGWSDVRALAFEINFNYHSKNIFIDGFEFAIHHKNSATQGEYKPNMKLIIVNDSELCEAHDGIHRQASHYLNDDTDWRGIALTKSKDRTAAKTKAAAYVQTILTKDYRQIKTTLAHEIIHAMDDKTWLNKSTDKLQKFLDKKVGKRHISYGRAFMNTQPYLDAYHNASHERNAFYRAFVAMLMRDIKNDTVKLSDFPTAAAFKSYCIDNYDLRYAQVNTKNKRAIDKRLADLYLRLKSQALHRDAT